MPIPHPEHCPLCRPADETVLFRSAPLRVVLADEPAYPGLCRVVWNAHVAEMTDLQSAERDQLMQAVWATEQVLREILTPEKINLASLGNQVPHLHWHIIPRFQDDPTFPGAIWASAIRPAVARNLPADCGSSLARLLAARLA